jgi:hypothetical protein
MLTVPRRLVVIAAAIVAFLLCTQNSASARGSQVGHDDPWNPEHIDRLPPEVRSAIVRMCGASPHAAHYFATFFDNSRVIKLHYEHLLCGERVSFCRGGNCLRQEYVATGGHYRLLKTYYSTNGD